MKRESWVGSMGEKSETRMLEMLVGFCFRLEGKRGMCSNSDPSTAAFWLPLVYGCDGYMLRGTESMFSASSGVQHIVDTVFSPMVSAGTA